MNVLKDRRCYKMLKHVIIPLLIICSASQSLVAQSLGDVTVFGKRVGSDNAQVSQPDPDWLLSLIEKELVDKFKKELKVSVSDQAVKEEWDEMTRAAGFNEETINQAKLQTEALIDLLTVLRAKGRGSADEYYKLKYADVLPPEDWALHRDHGSAQVDLEKLRRSTSQSVEDAFEKSKKSLKEDVLRRDVMIALSRSNLGMASKDGVERVLLSTLGGTSKLSGVRDALARRNPSDIVYISAVRVWWYAAISRGISLGDIKMESPIDQSKVIEEIASRIGSSYRMIEIRREAQTESLETRLNKPMPPDTKTGVNQ